MTDAEFQGITVALSAHNNSIAALLARIQQLEMQVGMMNDILTIHTDMLEDIAFRDRPRL